MTKSTPQIVIIGGILKTNNYHHKDILFFSRLYLGGPVGLFTGIQIKILIPEINVVIYEKHEQYQRNHVLRLNKRVTFFGLLPSPLLTNMINNLPSIVRTSVFETQLLELTKQLQIPIIYKIIDNLNEFSKSQIIIGADGSHSIVRQLIFNNQMKTEQILKYVLEIKYEVYGQGEKLDYLRHEYRTQKILKYLTDEHIGTQKDHRTPITLHLLIDQQMYEQMKSATFKNPYYLHTHQHLIPKDLLESITIWFNVKEKYANEKRIENSEKITCIALFYYESIDFVHNDKEKHQYICLVGDAAFGVPFFRSLNNGLICSQKLASSIRIFFNEYSSEIHHENLLTNFKFKVSTTVNQLHSFINVNKPLKAYNQFVHFLAKEEIFLAQNKANFLFAKEMMNKINGIVPWQVNKWSPEKLEKFKKKTNDDSQVNGEICFNSEEDEIFVQEFDYVPSMTIQDE